MSTPLTNETLVQKAIITADTIAAQGRLNAQQSEKFIDYVVDMSGLKNNARVVRVTTDWEIDKIGIGRRVAMPAIEAVNPSGRRGVTTSKVTITPKTIIVPVEIGDGFRQENIEGESIDDTVIRLFARQLANDMEELFLNGDVLGPAVLEGDIKDGGSTTQYIKDSYLALFNGWLRLARGANVYSAAGVGIGPSVFSGMKKLMPDKFLRNMDDLRYITSTDLEQNYREKVSTRATAAGDNALHSRNALTPFGIPLTPFPLFPFNPVVVEHVTLPAAATTVTLSYAPIVSGSEIVTLQTLDQVPTTPYIKDTDYEINYTTGAINAKAAGALEAGANVKVTYKTAPQCLLTHYMNFIVGISKEVSIEKDRDIYKRVNQYAITAKIGCNFEELTALVLAKNIGESV